MLLCDALDLQREEGVGHLLLDFDEHQTKRIPVASTHVGELYAKTRALLSEAIEAGLLKVQVRDQSSSGTCIEVKSGSAVGFVTTEGSGGARIFVQVRPKVGTQRMIELASLAGMLPPWSPGGAFIRPSLHDAVLEWTLRAFLDALTRLIAKGGLRNAHERIQEDLVNRLKGRLLVGRWLRNVSKGSPHILPSEFPSLQADNVPNRLLKWALRTALSVARDVLKKDDLVDGLSRMERHFSGVTLERFASGVCCVRILPPSMRHYKEAIEAARYVIDSAKLGSRAGCVESMSLVIDMNRVYESAFFNGLRSLVPEAARQGSWPIVLRSSDSSGTGSSLRRTVHMRPDVWIEPGEHRRPIVIDTKWKHVLSGVSESEAVFSEDETRTVQINSADIYQAIAYGVEVMHQRQVLGKKPIGCVTGLVYPTLREIPDLGTDFSMDVSGLSLALLGWNVSEPPMIGISAVWDRICLLAAHQDADQKTTRFIQALA